MKNKKYIIIILIVLTILFSIVTRYKNQWMVYIAQQELESVFYEYIMSEYLTDEDDSINGFDFTNERYIKGERERAFISLVDEEIKLNMLSTKKLLYHYEQYNMPSRELTIDGKKSYLVIQRRRENEFVGTELVSTEFYVLFVMLDDDENMLKLIYNDKSYDYIEKEHIDDKVIYIYDFVMTDKDMDTSIFIDMLTEENFIVDKK